MEPRLIGVLVLRLLFEGTGIKTKWGADAQTLGHVVRSPSEWTEAEVEVLRLQHYYTIVTYPGEIRDKPSPIGTTMGSVKSARGRELRTEILALRGESTSLAEEATDLSGDFGALIRVFGSCRFNSGNCLDPLLSSLLFSLHSSSNWGRYDGGSIPMFE